MKKIALATVLALAATLASAVEVRVEGQDADGKNGTAGSTGDGGPATAALVNKPTNLVLDGGGNIYFSDWGSALIRMISSSGTMVRIAGNGLAGAPGPPPPLGSGGRGWS